MGDFTQQLGKVRRRPWVSLRGLIQCTTDYLISTGVSPVFQSISFLGSGGFNSAYRIVFQNDIQFAACVSNSFQEDFNPEAKRSEIDTMKFVRESGLYPHIPVPRVYTWDATYTNPVRAPYVLMDVVQGETLQEYKNEENGLRGLEGLPHKTQLCILKQLVHVQASLFKPVPFRKIGSILAEPAGEYTVGPLMTISGNSLGGPFESVQELWRSLLEQQMLQALRKDSETENDESSFPESNFNPQEFIEFYQLMAALIPLFKIPQEYNSLVLHHPDIALRNVLFDKESLSSNEPRITGVIDWGGAQIRPLILAAQYPDDLLSSSDRPFKHPAYSLNEDWSSVPFDWTSIGDKTTWPKRYSAPGKQIDDTPRVTGMVHRFYLRAYFTACFHEEMHLLHGASPLKHATLFTDATYYLKFHECLRGGWTSWAQHATWIQETYWRLRNLGGKVVGPNIYRGSVRPAVIDLRIPSDTPPVEKVDPDVVEDFTA